MNNAKWDLTNRLASQRDYAQYYRQYCTLMLRNRTFSDWTAWVFTISPSTGLSIVTTGGLTLTEPLRPDSVLGRNAVKLTNGEQVRISGQFVSAGGDACPTGLYGSGGRPRPNLAEVVRFTKIAPLS